MQRSPIAWLYWLCFVACVALVVGLNLPWPGLPPQDPSALLRDPWFIWGFTYFGLLLMPMAALLIDDALRKRMLWPVYVIPYFIVGILPLSIYMARRPVNDLITRKTPAMLEQRWLWWALIAILIAASVVLLPRGSFAGLIETMRQNLGWSFMWLDIGLNHIVALPLVQADMRRRSMTNQTPWLIAILLTGPIALCAYMARRPASR
jgi:hypothetical protein